MRLTPRTLILLAVALLVAWGPLDPSPQRAVARGKHRRHATVERTVSIPSKALDVYRYVVKNGRAPAGYVGGRVWENRERRLPAGGRYREYDVNPKVRGQNRGAERIIVDESSREGWYTADHYRTFQRIQTK